MSRNFWVLLSSSKNTYHTLSGFAIHRCAMGSQSIKTINDPLPIPTNRMLQVYMRPSRLRNFYLLKDQAQDAKSLDYRQRFSLRLSQNSFRVAKPSITENCVGVKLKHALKFIATIRRYTLQLQNIKGLDERLDLDRPIPQRFYL